jgi:hypothetical protein
MDFLIHLFHTVITYPVLNLFIWLYEQTHSFSLTIILLTCIIRICLAWPERYLTARGKENQHQLLYGSLPRLLSCLDIYITYGMYFMLVVLGGSSLQALNNVLYAPVPHLSTLPNYDFSLFGQVVSLVHPGVILGLLLIITLTTLANAYLAVRRTTLATEQAIRQTVMQVFAQDVPEEETREVAGTINLGGNRHLSLGCTFLTAAFIYLFSAGFAIIFACLFAAGTLLGMMTSSILELFANIVLYMWTYRHQNQREAAN